jgi:hypothetical protein
MSRFLYLNIYSLLLVCAGILALVLPFYLITKWTLIIQVIIAVKIFIFSARLFSTWENKKREIDLLVKRNKNEFRPDTFEVYMQAPCGRLVARAALRDLSKQEECMTLLKLQKPLLERLRNNCTPSKTVVFINEEKI